jgi:hypothetical protein
MEQHVSMRTIRLYEPVADEEQAQDILATRSGSLQGKVVALLDNTKPLVDSLLDEVRTLLERDFPGAQFRYFKKESVSGAGPELMEELATCDTVVTAIGD